MSGIAYTRRGVLKVGTAVALLGLSTGACTAVGSIKEETGELGPVSFRYAPQFYLGDPEATIRVEFAWAARSQLTRQLYEEKLKHLIGKVGRRNDALLVFHHLCQDAEEAALSEVLLSVNPEYYGPVCLATLKFYAAQGQEPDRLRLASFLEGLKVPKDPEFDNRIARETTKALDVYLSEIEGVATTPSVFGAGSWKMSATPEDLTNMLQEMGYAG